MKMYYFNYSNTIQLHHRTKRATDVCEKISSHTYIAQKILWYNCIIFE